MGERPEAPSGSITQTFVDNVITAAGNIFFTNNVQHTMTDDQRNQFKIILEDLVRENNRSMLTDILRYTGNVDGAGNTPLHLAVAEGNSAFVGLVLNRPGVRINALNADGQTALNIAIQKGDEELVRALLAHRDINVNGPNADGQTALSIAVQKGDGKLVQALLTHPDISVNARNTDGQTALNSAIRKGDKELARELLTHPDIDVLIPNANGETALGLAIQDEDIDLVRAINNNLTRRWMENYQNSDESSNLQKAIEIAEAFIRTHHYLGHGPRYAIFSSEPDSESI